MRLKTVVVFIASLALLCGSSHAQTHKRRGRSLPGESVQLKTQDGWTLSARYQAPLPDRRTFVLLHAAGGRKEDWFPLAKAMLEKGFGYLALDLRGHGQSQNPPPNAEGQWWKFSNTKGANEWANMASDVDAAFMALKARGIPENSIGLGGADVGSSIALRYAAVHKSCPAVFLLSPGLTYKDLTTVNAMRLYGRRPILMAVGQDDRRSFPETGILYQFAKTAAGDGNVFLLHGETEHGTKMLLTDADLSYRLVDWMEHPNSMAPPSIPTVSSGTSVSTSAPSPENASRLGPMVVPESLNGPPQSESPKNVSE